MKRVLKVFTSLTISVLVGVNVSACGIEYVRLDKDINKWDTDTIFSNSALLQAIDDTTIKLKNSLDTFYKPLFVNKLDLQQQLEDFHTDQPSVYFLITENNKSLKYDVYVPTLAIIYQAIILYEAHTKIDNPGLNTIEKIEANLSLKYPTKKLNSKNQIYIKSSKKENIIKKGIVTDNDIYQKDDKVSDDDLLLTKFVDSQFGTPGYVSVSSLIELTIQGKKNNPEKYFNYIMDKPFFVTISWL